MNRIGELLGEGPVIDLTPMIDVIFLLVIFWMTVSVMKQGEVDRSIHPPESQIAERAAALPSPFVLNVPADGRRLIWQGRPVSTAQFAAAVEGMDQVPDEIVIRADGSVAAVVLQRVVGLCRQVGIGRIGFAVSPRPAARNEREQQR